MDVWIFGPLAALAADDASAAEPAGQGPKHSPNLHLGLKIQSSEDGSLDFWAFGSVDARPATATGPVPQT